MRVTCPADKVELIDGKAARCVCDAGYELLQSGRCTRCPSDEFFFIFIPQLSVDERCQPRIWTQILWPWSLVVVIVALLLALLRKVVKLAAHRRVQQHVERVRVKEALEGTTRLFFPFTAMPLAALRDIGKLVTHETARQAGQLVFVDSVDALATFSAETVIIFISQCARACIAN